MKHIAIMESFGLYTIYRKVRTENPEISVFNLLCEEVKDVNTSALAPFRTLE